MGRIAFPQLWKPVVGQAIQAGNPLARGLLAAWPMNEANGTPGEIVGNRATTVNGATWSAAGKYGPAMAFNGTTQYITTTIASGLSGDFTLACWAYPTSTGATSVEGAMESHVTSYGNHWCLLGISTGRWEFDLYDGTHNPVITSLANAAANAWTHVVGVRRAGTIYLYVNGVLQGSATDTTTSIPGYSAFNIGAQLVPSNRYFPGRIDAPTVWSRGLSTAEVQSVYNNTWQIYRPPPVFDVIWYPQSSAPVTYSFSGPSGGTVNTNSAAFTITAAANTTDTFALADNSNGTFYPSAPAINAGNTATFLYNPGSVGPIVITPTSNAADVITPSSLTYNSTNGANGGGGLIFNAEAYAAWKRSVDAANYRRRRRRA
jgi:hypothetical protein